MTRHNKTLTRNLKVCQSKNLAITSNIIKNHVILIYLEETFEKVFKN